MVRSQRLLRVGLVYLNLISKKKGGGMRLGTVRLTPPVMGGMSAGMCVVLPFSSLYSPQVSCQDLFLLGVCICRTGAMVTVCVRSPLSLSIL